MARRFEINWLPGEAVLLGRIHAGYHVLHDTLGSPARLIARLEEAREPAPYILDLSRATLTPGEMVAAMALLARSHGEALRHPKLSMLCVVTQPQLVGIGASALRQASCGDVRTQVFASLPEARLYLRLNPSHTVV